MEKLLLLMVGACALTSAQKNIENDSPKFPSIPASCPPCNLFNCPSKEELDHCEAGITKDECGCCLLCAQKEGQLCDKKGVTDPDIYFGNCGKNMDCQEQDVDFGKYKQALCICLPQFRYEVCGSDDITYDSLCRLKEASIRAGKVIKAVSKTPCKTGAVIDTPPSNTRNKTGGTIILACEASGYPIPTISWTRTRINDKKERIPGADHHVMVLKRGGPRMYQVTSWLQIIELEKMHQGDYTCTARNSRGSAVAAGRVNVEN